ncbi:MAG: hypothetical protein KAJ19_27790 [Gammaproteobacteria bacterium]|nr:hypothetical protein [Gammaproteobacteria bacterium]
MADLDYYASFADVKDILENAGLGDAGNTLLDDDAIEKILKIAQAKLHLRLGLTTLTSQTDVIAVELLKEMQVTYILQWIIAARHANENNLSDIGIVQTFWTMAPTFTFAQQADLALIKRVIDVNKGSANYNMRTGART